MKLTKKYLKDSFTPLELRDILVSGYGITLYEVIRQAKAYPDEVIGLVFEKLKEDVESGAPKINLEAIAASVKLAAKFELIEALFTEVLGSVAPKEEEEREVTAGVETEAEALETVEEEEGEAAPAQEVPAEPTSPKRGRPGKATAPATPKKAVENLSFSTPATNNNTVSADLEDIKRTLLAFVNITVKPEGRNNYLALHEFYNEVFKSLGMM